MSTILKALRRLEEDGSGKPKASDLEASADSISYEGDATPSAESAAEPHRVASAPSPPARRAPTDPRATEELRERILAEERASEVARTTRGSASRLARDESARPVSTASLGESLAATPSDPFANRIVEPAFTPPSSAKLGRPGAGIGAASNAPAPAVLGGLLSRGVMWGALALGLAAVFLAGVLFSGSTRNSTEAPSLAAREAPAPAIVAASPEATRALDRPDPIRDAEQVASGSTGMGEIPAAPVRPMTVSRKQRAPRAAARPEAAAARVMQSPPPAPRATPAPKAEQAPRPEPSGALARAAVTPTRAVREANAQGAEAIVAARPRAQTFSGERARVSAAAPDPTFAAAAAAPVPAEPVRVAAAATRKSSTEELPMAELAPARPDAGSEARNLPQAASRAGSVRPSARPTVSREQAAPEVEVVQRRGLPDLTVIRTSWHPASDRRSAKIRLEAQNELVTLREGDAVGGMVIEEISPSAVVFSAGEVQIRRRVGEASFGR